MRAVGYVGLDLGGTGAKAGVFDDSGRMAGFARVSYTPTSPSFGMAEVGISVIYEAARDAVRAATATSGLRIAAMSISSQGQTFVSLDEKAEPLHPAILWYDTRATAQAESLRLVLGASGHELEAAAMETISSAPKIAWLRERYPELMSRARWFLLLPDYLSLRLSGVAITDPCTASSTGLLIDGTSDYSPAGLAAVGIRSNQLADVKATGSPISTITPSAAKEWNLEDDTLLVTGTNDQYAGALGAGNCVPGIVSATLGTCLALVTLTSDSDLSLPAGLYCGAFPATPYRFVLAYAKTAGVVLEWLAERFFPGKSMAEIDALAAAVPEGARGVRVLPHFDGVVSPTPNSSVRGFVGGLTLGHTGADIYRAALESLAFDMRENLEAMRRAGLMPEVVRAIGGGAKSDLWAQMSADVCGLSVERPRVTEAATLGAAIIAAVGSGRFSSVQECSSKFCQTERVFRPRQATRQVYEEAFQSYQNLFGRVYSS